jgi:hypothetical protein
VDRVWDEMWDKNSAALIHKSFSIAYKNFWKTSPPPFLLIPINCLISLYFCKRVWLALYQGLYQKTGI